MKVEVNMRDQRRILANASRREFLCTLGQAALVTAGCGTKGLALNAAAGEFGSRRSSADSCIFIWLGGGASHIDMWDPKLRGDAAAKKPGSYYAAIATAIGGVQVCEHLQKTGPLLDRFVLLRSVFHNVIDEHAAAVNRLHTGRPTTGTTTYPSLGSVVSHQLGARGDGVPPYVLMGYPSASRGPGFLGARHGYIYLTDTNSGPAGLRRPDFISDTRQHRRVALLEKLRSEYRQKHAADQRVARYVTTSQEAFKLAGPEFAGVFDLSSENDALRAAYGSEFGQRCLLARRLVEAGVPFVEVSFNLNFLNGTGWDTHNEGQLKQHLLIQDLDQSLSTLVTDLEKRKRLDRTLIVVATEFGRPPEFDGGGGRGHHSDAFSIVLAGGGLKTGQAVGVTDELGKNIVEQPISIPDLHATIYTALGIDPSFELNDGDRPVPITDHGNVVSRVFS